MACRPTRRCSGRGFAAPLIAKPLGARMRPTFRLLAVVLLAGCVAQPPVAHFPWKYFRQSQPSEAVRALAYALETNHYEVVSTFIHSEGTPVTKDQIEQIRMHLSAVDLTEWRVVFDNASLASLSFGLHAISSVPLSGCAMALRIHHPMASSKHHHPHRRLATPARTARRCT